MNLIDRARQKKRLRDLDRTEAYQKEGCKGPVHRGLEKNMKDFDMENFHFQKCAREKYFLQKLHCKNGNFIRI